MEKSVAPSPTHWCSSYRKGSLRVTLDYGRQLYLLTYTSTELKELINAGVKLVCKKIRVSLKSTKKNQNLDGKFDWKCR